MGYLREVRAVNSQPRRTSAPSSCALLDEQRYFELYMQLRCVLLKCRPVINKLSQLHTLQSFRGPIVNALFEMRLSHKISDSFLLIGDSYKIFCGDRNNDLEEVKGDDCTLGHKQLSTRII